MLLFDNLNKELIYKSSYPFKLDILLTNESFYPSIDPTSLNTIKTKIKDFRFKYRKGFLVTQRNSELGLKIVRLLSMLEKITTYQLVIKS